MTSGFGFLRWRRLSSLLVLLIASVPPKYFDLMINKDTQKATTLLLPLDCDVLLPSIKPLCVLPESRLRNPTADWRIRIRTKRGFRGFPLPASRIRICRGHRQARPSAFLRCGRSVSTARASSVGRRLVKTTRRTAYRICGQRLTCFRRRRPPCPAFTCQPRGRSADESI